MKIKQLKWHPYSTDGWGKIEEGNYSADIILGPSYYIVKDDNSFQKEYGYKNCNYKLFYGYKNVEDPYYYILKNEEFYELWLGYDYKKNELLDTYSSLDIAKKEAQKHLEKLIKGLIENV